MTSLAAIPAALSLDGTLKPPNPSEAMLRDADAFSSTLANGADPLVNFGDDPSGTFGARKFPHRSGDLYGIPPLARGRSPWQSAECIDPKRGAEHVPFLKEPPPASNDPVTLTYQALLEGNGAVAQALVEKLKALEPAQQQAIARALCEMFSANQIAEIKARDRNDPVLKALVNLELYSKQAGTTNDGKAWQSVFEVLSGILQTVGGVLIAKVGTGATVASGFTASGVSVPLICWGVTVAADGASRAAHGAGDLYYGRAPTEGYMSQVLQIAGVPPNYSNNTDRAFGMMTSASGVPYGLVNLISNSARMAVTIPRITKDGGEVVASLGDKVPRYWRTIQEPAFVTIAAANAGVASGVNMAAQGGDTGDIIEAGLVGFVFHTVGATAGMRFHALTGGKRSEALMVNGGHVVPGKLWGGSDLPKVYVGYTATMSAAGAGTAAYNKGVILDRPVEATDLLWGAYSSATGVAGGTTAVTHLRLGELFSPKSVWMGKYAISINCPVGVIIPATTPVTIFRTPSSYPRDHVTDELAAINNILTPPTDKPETGR